MRGQDRATRPRRRHRFGWAICNASGSARRIVGHVGLYSGFQPAAETRMRRQTVENPFGTLKAWMGSTHFLTKTFPNIGGQSVDHRARPSVSQVFSFSTSSVRPMPRGGVVDQDAPPCAIPNQRAVQKKTRAQHLRAKPLKVLVGRVGIEPTTNGLSESSVRRALSKRVFL